MKAFYSALMGGAGTANAHRSAALTLIKSRFADPHYWALWKLLG
jgi:CHAT domain-containing protein